MLVFKKLVTAVLTLGIVGIAGLISSARAQEESPPENRPIKRFGERLGDFGRSIFSDEKPVLSPPARRVAPRAGGVQARPAQRTPQAAGVNDPPKGAGPSVYQVQPQRSAAPAEVRQRPAANNWAPPALDERVTASNSDSAVSAQATGSDSPSDSSDSGMPPLHERLKQFRGSAFSNSSSSDATPPVADGAASEPSSNSPAAAPVERPVEQPAERSYSPGSTGGDLNPPRETPTPAPRRVPGRAIAPPPAISSDSEPEPRQWSPSPRVEPQKRTGSDVLFARKSPILSVESTGPRQISVGKVAAYEITLLNSGEVAAEEVTVFIDLPEWTEVAGAEASVGNARPTTPGSREPLQWMLGRIEAKSREKLVLRIVPKENRPFKLAVRPIFKAAASEATIEVQEPKLAMRMEGPREVFFGKRSVFKLKLANTGNGAAENVVIGLLALGTGDNQPLSHRLGTLPAGEERSIEVELTARQAGDLAIQVEARGDGNVRTELAEKIFVRRAGLEVAMAGPGVQYLGTAAGYRIQVRNPGNAPARNVRIGVVLPAGVKYVSGSDGAKLAAGGTRVQWALDTLEAAGERVLTLKCNLGVAGASRLDVAAVAEDELTASAAAMTRVEAMADLRLDVKDPEGPVPVGEEATYELHVRNRGTKTAENVEVIAYFSKGIEPTGAEGQPNRLGPGQVVFSPVPSLAPGAEVKLRVRARAEAMGNHVFRAEVHCRPLGARLVREETTHFYQDGPQQAQRNPLPPGALPPREQAEPSVLPGMPSGPQPAPLMR